MIRCAPVSIGVPVVIDPATLLGSSLTSPAPAMNHAPPSAAIRAKNQPIALLRVATMIRPETSTTAPGIADRNSLPWFSVHAVSGVKPYPSEGPANGATPPQPPSTIRTSPHRVPRLLAVRTPLAMLCSLSPHLLTKTDTSELVMGSIAAAGLPDSRRPAGTPLDMPAAGRGRYGHGRGRCAQARAAH